jgi:hypothetical protein
MVSLPSTLLGLGLGLAPREEAHVGNIGKNLRYRQDTDSAKSGFWDQGVQYLLAKIQNHSWY